MTEEMMVEENASPRVYEVGYLLLPSIPEEHIPENVSRLEALVAKHGGSKIADGKPELRTLAYEMEKAVGTRNEHFTSAYFGWMKFEVDPEGVLALKSELDKDVYILRFILIKTARDAHIPPKPREMKSEIAAEAPDAPVVAATPAVFSQEEIDKSIEELVVE